MAAAVASQPPTAPVTRYQGVDKQSSGYKLLAAMGWKEGEGLGAARQGIKEHIKVKKKFENWGVGAVEAAEKARDWTTGMLDFHRVLSTLSEITSQHARGRESGYDSGNEEERDEAQRSDASDGEVKRRKAAAAVAGPSASGEAADSKGKKRKKAKAKRSAAASGEGEEPVEAAGGKKRRSKKGDAGAAPAAAKKRRGALKGGAAAAAAAAQPAATSSSSDSESGSNAGSGSSSEESEGEAPAAAPRRVKFATHVGRFKRREAAKMVKNYSSTDLAAILGGGAGGAGPATAAIDPMLDMAFPSAAALEVRAERAAESSDSSDSEGEEAGGRREPVPSLGGATSGQTASGLGCSQGAGTSGLGSAEEEEPAALSPKDRGEGTWWGGYFARGARRGGAGGEGSGQPKITIHGFREEDQENLFHLAQDGRTQGRVGLGRSSMPKKVAGARWQGKKTKLGSDSEGEDEEPAEEPAAAEQAQQAQQAPGEVHLGNGVVVILPPSKLHQLPQLLGQATEQAQQADAGGAAAAAAGGKQRSNKRSKQEAGAGADGLAGLKWGKLVLAQLKASGKSKLSVAKLSKAISKQRGLGKAARGQVEELVAAAAGSNGKLSLKDGVVRLAA